MDKNFLLSMFRGEVEITAFPPFNKPEFHACIGGLRAILEELPVAHVGGPKFLTDFKLLMAQLAVQDWASLDSKRVIMRANLLRKHLPTAVALGAQQTEALLDFDRGAAVSDAPLPCGLALPDAHLELLSLLSSGAPGPDGAEGQRSGAAVELDFTRRVLPLLQAYDEHQARQPPGGSGNSSGGNGGASFEECVLEVIERRCQRVRGWLAVNTAAFDAADPEVVRLRGEMEVQLVALQQTWTFCRAGGCGQCFLPCRLNKGHAAGHNCLTSHACAASCSFCCAAARERAEEGCIGSVFGCAEKAGHAGSHDCKVRSHTCGLRCALDGMPGCVGGCVEVIGHAGQHMCKGIHTCDQVCSLAGCGKPCIVPVGRDHERHVCMEKKCPQPCCMRGCIYPLAHYWYVIDTRARLLYI